MTNNENALETQNMGYLALANNNIAAMISEELDGLDTRFDKIKTPFGGNIVFEMPGEGDETESVEDFAAVIIYHHPLFTYYNTPYDGGSLPPDCGSMDGVEGVGNSGGKCKTCPLNQYGSGGPKRKACQNHHRLYLLKEGELFPLLLSVPPTSLGTLTNYLKRQLSQGRNSNAIVTRFSMRKTTNTSNKIISQAQFAYVRTLTSEEYAVIHKLSGQIKKLSTQVAYEYDASADDYEEVDIDPETGEILRPSDGYNPGDDGDDADDGDV